ncbi:MAG: transposase [Chloroflexota bacterium]|nr:transposase [Chloroflexota bacterium]
MAKATITIKHALTYQPQHAAWFASNQVLFNQVVAFYFDVIQAHEKVLERPNTEALTALESLTHTTRKNPDPVMPLSAIFEDIPAMFRRAAINAALGSARSFFSHLNTWNARRQKALAKKKTFTERPPVPPRTWNTSVPFYMGQWKERTDSSIILKVWNGKSWSWVKVRTLGRDLPAGFEWCSPALIRHGDAWWLHTPIEKKFKGPAKIAEQITENQQTKICSVDLNVGENIAVCTVQTAEGTILATRFITGGKEISGFRKKQLGRIARNRRKTSIIAEGEQDNAALWRKIRTRDEDLAHQVSARIVQCAKAHGASILVFEHLGNLTPQKGKYSRRGNTKRAFWMKGRIFTYAKYKAYNEGILTSRVNPRNTSRECACCHALIARYSEGQAASGYTMGAPLVFCSACGMRGNADRNASLVIGQRLIARYRQEKPPTPLQHAAERDERSSGFARSQDANSAKRPSPKRARRQGTGKGHGTAHEECAGMVAHSSSIPTYLRLVNEERLRLISRTDAYGGVEEAAVPLGRAECHTLCHIVQRA